MGFNRFCHRSLYKGAIYGFLMKVTVSVTVFQNFTNLTATATEN